MSPRLRVQTHRASSVKRQQQHQDFGNGSGVDFQASQCIPMELDAAE